MLIANSDPPLDAGTRDYFDAHLPEYDVARFDGVVQWLRRAGRPDATLLDVGCGTGNVLAHLRDAAGITRLAGLDVSPRCCEATRRRVAAEAFVGSILDPSVVEPRRDRYDYVVLGAVLHHLIGATRRASRARARQALGNALTLARPGGHVFVVEPVLYPPMVMDAAFYVKKVGTAITSRRLEIFDTWNNLGAPVVSYYTLEELVAMARADSRAEVVEAQGTPARRTRLQRLLIRRKDDALLVLRRVHP